MIHTYAWIAWLLAALISLSATRNPLYLILIILCIALVYQLLAQEVDSAPVPVAPLRFTLIVITLTTVFNALTSHFGETVLFTIPGQIPLLSGKVTLEAMVYGATNGLILSGFFASFLVLNQALPVRALLRLVPRAFYPVAVVISVAVTYIPSTQRQFTQIREAQAIRGYQPRGLRGWLPLLMPLLVGGLEQALTLAEAMTARGFASPLQQSADNLPKALISIGLLLLPAGWILSLIKGIPAFAPALMMVFGSLLIVYGLWYTGRALPRTSYRQEIWKNIDWIVLIGTLIVSGVYLFPHSKEAGLAYSPYPLLTAPPFTPLIGIMTLGLLVPVLFIDRNQNRSPKTP